MFRNIQVSLLVSQLSVQLTMINLVYINWVTTVFYMQVENQLWTEKIVLANKEIPLIEHLLPYFPATSEENLLYHVYPKFYVEQESRK